jgi:hypothetical protein
MSAATASAHSSDDPLDPRSLARYPRVPEALSARSTDSIDPHRTVHHRAIESQRVPQEARGAPHVPVRRDARHASAYTGTTKVSVGSAGLQGIAGPVYGCMRVVACSLLCTLVPLPFLGYAMATEGPDRTSPAVSIGVAAQISRTTHVPVRVRVRDDGTAGVASVWIEYRTPSGDYSERTPMHPDSDGLWTSEIHARETRSNGILSISVVAEDGSGNRSRKVTSVVVGDMGKIRPIPTFLTFIALVGVGVVAFVGPEKTLDAAREVLEQWGILTPPPPDDWPVSPIPQPPASAQ